MTNFVPTTNNCDQYLDERTGKYEWRAVRYRKAIDTMFAHGLDDSMTVFDIGAGMTEFDYCLRAEYDWRGRYVPIDGGIDGTDLNRWSPPREGHWFVALEIMEHLHHFDSLLNALRVFAQKGVIISTPNPRTTDVIGMDPTHVRAIHPEDMTRYGYEVTEETFYGSAFNLPGHEGEPDSLFGVWTR